MCVCSSKYLNVLHYYWKSNTYQNRIIVQILFDQRHFEIRCDDRCPSIAQQWRETHLLGRCIKCNENAMYIKNDIAYGCIKDQLIDKA